MKPNTELIGRVQPDLARAKGRTVGRQARKYLKTSAVALRQLLVHRTALLMQMITTLISLAATYFLWSAAVGDGELQGYNLPRLATYLVFSHALHALVSEIGIIRDIGKGIRQGDIVQELVRPVDFQFYLLSQEVGRAIYKLVALVFPLLAVAVLWLQPAPPRTWWNAGLFIISSGLGFLIALQVAFLVGLGSFWTVVQRGLLNANRLVDAVLSGQMIPITLLPKWLQTVSQALPYQATVYIPVWIYQDATPGEALKKIGFQVIWVIVLFILGRIVLNRAYNRLDIVGG